MQTLKLNRMVSRSNSVDPDDSLAMKKALLSLGLYDMPSYGLTEFPDEEMIAGIRTFQDEEGVLIDGVVNPNGPTINAFNRALERKHRDSLSQRGLGVEAQVVDPDRTHDIRELEGQERAILVQIENVKERIKQATDPIRVRAFKLLLKKHENDLSQVKYWLAIARGERA